MKHLCSICLLLAAKSLFPQSSSGNIQGTIADQDGQAVVGAAVSAVGAYVAQIAGGPPQGDTYSTVSTTGGQFNFASINPGAYIICVTAPSTAYLDPCVWSSGLSVVVRPGETVPSANVVLAKGAMLQLSIADPGQRISKSNGVVLAGVTGPSNAFHALMVVASNSLGRSLQIAVPYDTALRFEISSSRLQLADVKGAALSALTTAIPIQVAKGQSDPSLSFTVTGTR